MITVSGSCLGSGGLARNGDSAYLVVRDLSAKPLWDACYDYKQADGPAPGTTPDTVVCTISKWQKDSVSFGHFGGAYGSRNMKLRVGDHLVVLLWNPQTGAGPGACEVTVGAAGAGGQTNCREIVVPATADIFAAGLQSVPPRPGGGGTVPPSVTVVSGETVSLVAFGLTNCCNSTPGTPPSGQNSSMNISGFARVSGLVDSSTAFFLAGVFTGNVTPARVPPALNFSPPPGGLGQSFTRLTPKLDQTFYVGSGFTPSGTQQRFTAPAGATRLWLGMPDTQSFTGVAGYYADNVGYLVVALPAVPGAVASGSESSLASTLATPRQAFSSPVVVLASVAVAAGGVLFITFPAQLFNLTFQENYEEISGYFSKRARRARAALSRLRQGRESAGSIGMSVPSSRPASERTEGSRFGPFALVVVVGSVLDGLLDPNFGANVRTLESVLSILLAILVATAVAATATGAYHSRTGGRNTARRLNALPWGLAVAAFCVVVSRLANFEPGYLYGVVCGVAFERKLTKRQEAHVAAVSMLSVLGLSVAAFLVRGAVHGPAKALGASPLLVLTDDFLSAVAVGGLVGTTISLLPLQFLPGHRIRSWRMPVWFALFIVSLFSVIDFVVRSPAANAERSGFVPTVVLFVLFAGVSVGFREFFAARWRRAHGVQISGFVGLARDLLAPHPGEGVLTVEQAGNVAVVETEDSRSTSPVPRSFGSSSASDVTQHDPPT